MPQDDTSDAPLSARYFDGKTSRLHRVLLRVRDGAVHLDGEAQRSCALAELHVSERTRHAVRKLTFADGAYLEIDDPVAFGRLLGRSGHRDSWVVRLQQSWRNALLATAATVLVLAAGYVWLLPLAAGALARALPVALERRLGDGVLTVLDGRVFLPSKLPAARRQQLTQEFSRLLPPQGGAADWRVIYRHSLIGPNAFALPSGDIVLTDEMVQLLAGDDQAVMGVLAHELGHLHARHLTRRIIQGSVVTATTALLFGDLSSLLATVPAVALDLKYSRDAEREADDYAVAMLKRNGIAPEHLAQVFVKLGQLNHGDNLYLSSHPASAERIARIRAAARGGPAPD